MLKLLLLMVLLLLMRVMLTGHGGIVQWHSLEGVITTTTTGR